MAKALMGLVCLGCLATGAIGTARQESEQSVKAAFIYNFTRFVTWPDSAFSSADAPFVIAIVGDSNLESPLETLTRGKEVGDHGIVVKQVEWGDVGPCNILLVPSDESAKAIQLAKFKNRNILIVGESSGMLRKGATINLYIADDHVKFEISSSAAKDTGLSISSRLLSLARPRR